MSQPPTRRVHGRPTECRFGEDPMPEGAQLRVLDAPACPEHLPGPAVLDPGFEILHVALERALDRTPPAPVEHAPGHATRWLLVSPFELFLEHVVARKLGSIE